MGEAWSPELLVGPELKGEPALKGGPQTPLHTMWKQQSNFKLQYTDSRGKNLLVEFSGLGRKKTSLFRLKLDYIFYYFLTNFSAVSWDGVLLLTKVKVFGWKSYLNGKGWVVLETGVAWFWLRLSGSVDTFFIIILYFICHIYLAT